MLFSLNKQPHYYPWLHLAFLTWVDWVLIIGGAAIGICLLCLLAVRNIPESGHIVCGVAGTGWLAYGIIRSLIALILRKRLDAVVSTMGIVSLNTPLGVVLTTEQLRKTLAVVVQLLKEGAFPLVTAPDMEHRVLGALKGYSIVWVPSIEAQAYADTFTGGKKYVNTINGYCYGKTLVVATAFTWSRGYFNPMEQVLTTALVHELGHALILENLIKTGGITTDTWLNTHRFDDSGYQMHILDRLQLL